MKTSQFFYTLAASVMLAATAGLLGACTSSDDNPVSPSDNNKPWEANDLSFDLGTAKMGVKLVEGGAYAMQFERDGETKTVTGTLSDYYIGPVEVSNKVWAAVMGSKPEGQTNDGDMYPVTMVSYNDIAGPGGFLEKLNAMVKDQLPEGKQFMLPNPLQWQYAAQGGKKSKGYTYSGSNTIGDVAWYKDNSDATVHPIGQKQGNELELHDMSGNVRELTSRSLNDGKIIVCGGDWTSDAKSCNVKQSVFDASATASESLGIRLVLADAPQPVAVDLGLPSGTKWANMNVGASKPEDYGLYFAWGETVGYTSDTSDGHRFDWASYKWCNGSDETLTKYNTKSDKGTVDNKTVLDLEDDAAYVNWGDKWRMPTKEEQNELRTECTWTLQAEGNTEYNGVVGYKVTGTNGNSIFLPVAGWRENTEFRCPSEYGFYWSASLYEMHPGPRFATTVGFDLVSVTSNCSNSRRYGYPVRPVLRN